MKNILKSILVLGFFLTLMASCKKEEAAPELRVIETKLETGPLENIGTIQLSSADFTASVEDEWCKIQQEGDVIHIVVEQNAENKPFHLNPHYVQRRRKTGGSGYSARLVV